MLKIGIVAPRLSGTGGTETVIKKVIQKGGNDYSLFVLNDEKNKHWMNSLNISTKNVNTSSNDNNLVKLIRLFKFMTRKKFDALIVLDTKLLFYVSIFRRVLHLHFKIISWIHYSLFNEKLVDTKKLVLADYHLAISTGIKRQMMEIGLDKNKIDVVYNPIEKSDMTITNNFNDLIYIGRIQFNGQKNLQELFDGLVIAKKWRKLDIYGTGSDMIQCREYAKNLGLENKIVWHGWVENPWQDIKNGKALVMSSTYEGFPMVLLEALSRGLPCISANCPTGPEDIINSSNGLMYTMGNPNELADCIDALNVSKNDIKATINDFYSERYFEKFQRVLSRRLN